MSLKQRRAEFLKQQVEKPDPTALIDRESLLKRVELFKKQLTRQLIEDTQFKKIQSLVHSKELDRMIAELWDLWEPTDSVAKPATKVVRGFLGKRTVADPEKGTVYELVKRSFPGTTLYEPQDIANFFSSEMKTTFNNLQHDPSVILSDRSGRNSLEERTARALLNGSSGELEGLSEEWVRKYLKEETWGKSVQAETRFMRYNFAIKFAFGNEGIVYQLYRGGDGRKVSDSSPDGYKRFTSWDDVIDELARNPDRFVYDIRGIPDHWPESANW